MMNTYTISFVSTIYNTKKNHLIKLISSFKKDFEKYEFIFVDDGSENLEAINYLESNFGKFKNVKILKNITNSKRFLAFVAGVNLAQGKYIHSLDSDDYVVIKKLNKYSSFLKENDFDIIVNSYYWDIPWLPYFKIKHNSFSYKKTKENLNSKKINYSNPLLGASNTTYKSILIKKLNFDRQIKGPHDDLYIAQLFLNIYNPQIFFYNKPWFVYYINPLRHNFSGETIVSKNQVNHTYLLEAIITNFNSKQFFSYFILSYILFNQFKANKLILSEEELKFWLDSIYTKIKNVSFFDETIWQKTFFYRKIVK